MQNNDLMPGVGARMIPEYSYMERNPEKQQQRNEVKQENTESSQRKQSTIREERVEKDSQPARQPERPESEAPPTDAQMTEAAEAERSLRIAGEEWESTRKVDRYA